MGNFVCGLSSISKIFAEVTTGTGQNKNSPEQLRKLCRSFAFPSIAIYNLEMHAYHGDLHTVMEFFQHTVLGNVHMCYELSNGVRQTKALELLVQQLSYRSNPLLPKYSNIIANNPDYPKNVFECLYVDPTGINLVRDIASTLDNSDPGFSSLPVGLGLYEKSVEHLLSSFAQPSQIPLRSYL